MTEILSFKQEFKALSLCEQRASLIARNIANSGTPGFKAQDMNFYEAMQQARSGMSLQSTQKAHIATPPNAANGRLYYRVPMQLKMNENTVDDEIERKNFVDNSMRYQAGVGFIENRANQLIRAFKGE